MKRKRRGGKEEQVRFCFPSRFVPSWGRGKRRRNAHRSSSSTFGNRERERERNKAVGLVCVWLLSFSISAQVFIFDDEPDRSIRPTALARLFFNWRVPEKEARESKAAQQRSWLASVLGLFLFVRSDGCRISRSCARHVMYHIKLILPLVFIIRSCFPRTSAQLMMQLVKCSVRFVHDALRVRSSSFLVLCDFGNETLFLRSPPACSAPLFLCLGSFARVHPMRARPKDVEL